MIFRIIILSLVIFLQCLPVKAERGISITANSHLNRTALVIGNSEYKSSSLKNPANDASDMASALRNSGFEVILLTNASQRSMEKAIKIFGRKLRSGGTGLFYFAGHGVQIDGTNYLLPVDAAIESESDVKYDAVDAGRVLGKMEDAGNDLNIVILDACRNNPFARSFRSADKGLAKMDAPTGAFIAYATAPGSVAADGDGRNGLFTQYLLQYMKEPNLSVERVFKKVRLAVVKDTSRKQTPWESSSLVGDFYFQGDGKSNHPAALPSRAVQTLNAEEEMWKAVKNSTAQEDLRMYLDGYPTGRFSLVAKAKINQLNRQKNSSSQQPAKHKEPTTITTSSGLKYMVLKQGVGAPPAKGTLLTTHYTATLLNGNKFDSSVDRGLPFKFTLGVGQVIKGWDEAFLTMRKGEKRTLIIPPSLAYGSKGAGTIIPPNATLVFDVELIDF